MTDIVWQRQNISKEATISFAPGQRYAVLASVGTGTTLAAIQSYVENQSFHVTYLCEIAQGSASACGSRDTYDVDAWLAGITAPPRSGERWVYAEGNFNGSAPWSVSKTDEFPKTLVVTYSVADIFEAVPGVATHGGDVLSTTPLTPPGGAASAPYIAAGIGGLVLVGLGFWWVLKG